MNRHSQRLVHLPNTGRLNQRQVNGLGASFFDVIQDVFVETGERIVEGGRQLTEEQSAKFVDEILDSTEFSQILDRVEDAGETGVKKAAGENALYLLGVAVAGGAVGGMLSRSTVGIVATGALAAWAAVSLLGQGGE